MRQSLDLRETDKFIPSRLRPGNPNSSAVEVVIGNPEDISGGGGGGSVTTLNILSSYQERTSVAMGVTVNVISHTFSLTNDSKIRAISVSGTNIATYEMFIDSVLIEKKRTYFGSSLDAVFDFSQGYRVPIGATLEIKAHHFRPSSADFNATLKYTEAL